MAYGRFPLFLRYELPLEIAQQWFAQLPMYCCIQFRYQLQDDTEKHHIPALFYKRESPGSTT